MLAMIAQYGHLHRHPSVFRAMTGLTLVEFDLLLGKLAPNYQAQELQRHSRPERQRAIGAGRDFVLDLRDQLLVTLVWLRRYPTHVVLAWLFGVSDSTTVRIVGRILPLLERLGHATMRFPDPGKHHRRSFDELLAELPELAVVIDSFEQKVQRPKQRKEADEWYSGKKKTHTIKSQVGVDVHTGKFCDVSESAPGPTADITLLKASGLLGRLPEGVGAEGDLAYVGIQELHPTGLGATPRRKPRGQDRPEEDIAYNTAFSRRRIIVEHGIGRLRVYDCLTACDRQHRQDHRARVVAVAGLVNLHLDCRQGRLAA
jgi:DDE superfamily endonuclease/Helix-turn-helix of DDE superfamily endonuclease